MTEEERRAAVRKAVRAHDAKMVDKVTVRLPKGTADAIRDKGYSVNAFVIQAVLEKLERESDQ